MSERIDWLNGTPLEVIQDYLKWRSAIERVDAGKTDQLVDLLRGDLPLGPDARALIADVFVRYRLAKPRGGQRRPAYSLTRKEGKKRQLVKLVEYHRRAGLGLDDAISKALREDLAERLRLSGDDRVRTDDELDEMVPDGDFDYLQNRILR